MKDLIDGSVDISEEFNIEMGWSAGRLWHFLNNNGPTPMDDLLAGIDEIATPQLKKMLSPETKPQTAVYMAIGWLMRENKVTLSIDPKTRKHIVRLTH